MRQVRWTYLWTHLGRRLAEFGCTWFTRSARMDSTRLLVPSPPRPSCWAEPGSQPQVRHRSSRFMRSLSVNLSRSATAVILSRFWSAGTVPPPQLPLPPPPPRGVMGLTGGGLLVLRFLVARCSSATPAFSRPASSAPRLMTFTACKRLATRMAYSICMAAELLLGKRELVLIRGGCEALRGGCEHVETHCGTAAAASAALLL